MFEGQFGEEEYGGLAVGGACVGMDGGVLSGVVVCGRSGAERCCLVGYPMYTY